jgi:hypothetical protein
LECPAKIMADLEELRNDFILNEKESNVGYGINGY